MWEIIHNFMQIIMCLSLMVTTGIWMYIFRWFFKNHLTLRQRIDYLEHQINIIKEPTYRGYP